MAKRRKHKKTSRRRRVGAAMSLNANSTLVKFGAPLAGFLFAGKINPMIDKVTGTMDAKLIAAGQVGIGAAYMLSKGKKNLPLTLVTGIIAGAGLKRAMTAFGISGVGGYGTVPVIGARRVNGYQNVPVIGQGYQTPGQLNGYTTAGQKIMGTVGNASGSGISSNGSDVMN